MNESVKNFLTIGKIIALVILVVVIILAIIGKMPGFEAWLFGGLAAAIILN